MNLRITAKKEGFCRAGMRHPAEPVDHPDGTFTPEQIAALKAEPMLVVQEVPEEGDGEEPKAAKGKKDKASDGKEKASEPPASPAQAGEGAPQGESEQAKG